MGKKLEVIGKYDATAEVYDRRYAQIQRRKYEVVESFLPGRCGAVLDLGCGSGLFLESLARRSAVLVGIDISGRMLEKAGRRGKAMMVRGDAENLPFADGCFDVVVSVTVLQNLPDPGRAVREVARVLKRGGLAILTSLKKKHGPDDLEEMVRSAGLNVVRSGEIPDSEDSFCVAQR
jgi:ubiquinone/menaquinone biosynthesis C-methylase UbiE